MEKKIPIIKKALDFFHFYLLEAPVIWEAFWFSINHIHVLCTESKLCCLSHCMSCGKIHPSQLCFSLLCSLHFKDKLKMLLVCFECAHIKIARLKLFYFVISPLSLLDWPGCLTFPSGLEKGIVKGWRTWCSTDCLIRLNHVLHCLKDVFVFCHFVRLFCGTHFIFLLCVIWYYLTFLKSQFRSPLCPIYFVFGLVS